MKYINRNYFNNFSEKKGGSIYLSSPCEKIIKKVENLNLDKNDVLIDDRNKINTNNEDVQVVKG